MSVWKDILGGLGKGGTSYMAKKRLPQTEGELLCKGLAGKVVINRDQWGIPHIKASNLNDLLFAQGYVHAQDRLWQMEIARRASSGRLAEIVGKEALSTDRIARTIGFYRLGQEDLQNYLQDMAALLDSYVAGINSCIESDQFSLPIEFSVLQHKPEVWTTADTLAIARLMSWQLSHGWEGELVRANIEEAVSEVAADEIALFYESTNPTTIKKGIEVNVLNPADDPILKRGQGSNAWAIAGNRSQTGTPLLANDPHLLLNVPSIWYENQLKCGDLNVTGTTVPGLPFVLVGHNDHIAWGTTLSYCDCEDLFIERFNEQGTEYEYMGEWLKPQVIDEVIRVKGGSDHVEPVVHTVHGVVVSDVIGEKGKRVALQSTALKSCPLMIGWFELNHARNWEEFTSAIENIKAPSLNLVYADVHGNIGYYVTGEVPVRKKGNGAIPVPGWNGEYDWCGSIPHEEMPHVLNPECGYVVSCNHKVQDESYPHCLGDCYLNGFRARRIEDMIEERDLIDVEDCIDMQNDFVSIPGKEFCTHFTDLQSEDEFVQSAIDRMVAWDGDLDASTVGGTIYKVTCWFVEYNLYSMGMGEKLTHAFRGKGFHDQLSLTNEFYSNNIVVLLKLLRDSENWWVENVGGKANLLLVSVEQAVEYLQHKMGKQMDDWAWGKARPVSFAHTLGSKRPLNRIFNVGKFAQGGDADTPNQISSLQLDQPLGGKIVGPSYRYIIDMGDIDGARAVLPPGQSGNVASKHYNDQVYMWLHGQYRPQLFSEAQWERASKQKLELLPDF